MPTINSTLTKTWMRFMEPSFRKVSFNHYITGLTSNSSGVPRVPDETIVGGTVRFGFFAPDTRFDQLMKISTTNLHQPFYGCSE
jgi:hypothetical protein